MNIRLEALRKYVPSAAAALLFTALLAQAPHAATVFIRIAPTDVHWEVAGLAILGGVVYAIALESATAYFVWRNKMRWAIAFAAFSIMHNVAYYMPGAWTFDIAGAELSLRYIVSALLISASLPIAIAAFSHVHVETQHTDKRDEEKPVETPATHIRPKNAPAASVALPAVTLTPSSEVTPAAAQTGETSAQPEGGDVPKLTPEQRRAQILSAGLQSSAEVQRMFNISKRTADGDLAEVRKALLQTNGTGAH